MGCCQSAPHGCTWPATSLRHAGLDREPEWDGPLLRGPGRHGAAPLKSVLQALEGRPPPSHAYHYRLDMAAAQGYETIDFEDTDVRSALLEMTGGRGPDKCIDAVGLEATHGAAHIDLYDRAKHAVRSETDRPHALRQAITSCRSGGIVSVIGVYGGMIDKFPAGAWMNRSLTLRTGQCHVQRYMKPLLKLIEEGALDPTRAITHRLPLTEAPHAYEVFKHKQDNCEKVVLSP